MSMVFVRTVEEMMFGEGRNGADTTPFMDSSPTVVGGIIAPSSSRSDGFLRPSQGCAASACMRYFCRSLISLVAAWKWGEGADPAPLGHFYRRGAAFRFSSCGAT